MVTRKSPPSDQSTVEVRIIDFKLTGSDDALRESLQTISAAFGRQNVQVNRSLPAARTAQLPTATGNGAADEQEEEEQGDETVQDVQPKPAKEKKPSAPRKVPKIELLTDIRFDQVTPTLAEFFAEKNPQSDFKRYMVIAYWYLEYMKLPEINVQHFYTAYKFLNVPVPNDPSQVMRDLRARDTFSKGKETAHVFINHVGANAVQAMPKGAAA